MAKAVLNKSLDVMPEKNVPYEQPQIMWQVADMLFEAGDKERALALTKRLIELNDQRVDYYESLDKERKASIDRDTRMRIQISDRLTLLAKEYYPEDPEVNALYDKTQQQLQTMEMPSYETYLEQEKQMQELRRKQDSISRDGVKAQPKTAAPVEIGADGSIRKK